MTLTRELRTSIAFMLAVVMALTVFVWGNQRLVQASLATEILCLVDQVGDEGDGNAGIFPMFEEDCENGGGEVVDWCPNLPGTQSQSDLPCSTPPQCNDGLDNDNDGKVDWGVPGDADADPGCSTPTDDNEGDDPTPPAQCADGLDNDSDGLVDMQDPGCSSESDNDETDQGGGGGNPACSDGQDNDGDTKTDFPADPGCTDAQDTDETDGQGGGGDSPDCSDGGDNDGDGQIDFPADDDCTDAQDDNENDEDGGNGGGSSGGGSHHHHGGSSSNNNQGEVLGAQIECPMYLTGYIKYGAQNDAGEVAKLQVFLNNFEGYALPVTGTYGPQTLAAVNAFQNKYASDILTPWGAQGATGYVYYTTQKTINTIYCKFEKDFPLTASQIEEIAYVRQVQPTLRAQGVTSMGTTKPAPAAATPAVGSVVPPNTKVDENTGIIDPKVKTATAANATSTSGSGKGWFTNFINWLFGR